MSNTRKIKFTIEPPGRLTIPWRELWDKRELLYFFTWKDIRVKYKQTFLGFMWAFLQPFILMVVFSVFFGAFLEVPSDGLPYPIFAYSGLMLWGIFSNGVTNASNSIISNSGIIRKIYFPRLIIPFSSVLVALFDFIMAFIIYLVLLLWYGLEVNWLKLILFIPASVLITVFTTVGLGTLIASFNVKFRDFRLLIPFLVQLLLFLTPVIYPVSIVPGKWLQVILSLNPMAGAISLARSALISDPLNTQLVLISSAISVVLLLVGLFTFSKNEPWFSDLA